MVAAGFDAARLRTELEAGHLSRHDLLEELERRLARMPPDGPVEGVLEILLSELHKAPGDPQLLRLLARLYDRTGKLPGPTQALAAAQRAGAPVGGPPDADGVAPGQGSVEAPLVVGRVLLEAGCITAAEDAARQAVDDDPNSMSALNLLAKVCHVQGRLTEMIGLWQRVQLLSPHQEGALAHLRAIHNLTRDDEQAARSFVAMGEDLYVPKHEPQRVLERAYRKFRDCDFAAAIALCDRLASKHRGSGGGVYKLALLQKAWFQERMGLLRAAWATLEQLGEDAAYDRDLDRLSFLANVCEQLETTESLRQALSIHEHLHAQHGKMSSLPRLAALYRALGEPAHAEAYAREHHRRFAQRMQKPSAPEVVRALALQYIPLRRLPPTAWSAEDDGELALDLRLSRTVAGRSRRRALLSYLRGEVGNAERTFRRLCRSPGGSFEDHAYLGDLLARRRHRGALECYAEAVERGGAVSAPLLMEAVATADRMGAEPPLSERVSGSQLERAHQTLLSHARRQPAEPGRWEALSRFERWVERTELARTHAAKAQALRRASDGAPPDIGRVLAAAVLRLGGKPKGVIHEVLASRRATAFGRAGDITDADIFGNLTTELRGYVRLLLAITLDYARARWPHLTGDAGCYAYALRVTKDDELSGGNSAGLPIAVGFLSVVLQRPVPQDVALSGTLSSDSAGEVVVSRVGDADYKLKAAYHRNLQAIVLPAESEPDVMRGDIVPPAIAEATARYAARLDEVVELLWGPQAWDW